MPENTQVASACQVCDAKATTTCFACGMALCEKCSRCESIGASCVGERTVYYCPACAEKLP
jgi:hypothetical protein